jgi:predicted nucleic acid-binding protein
MGMIVTISQKNIYLDSNVFIYLLEGYPEFVPLLKNIFKLIDNGSLQAITSELTLAETLVKPMADKNFSLQQIYQNTIQASAVLQVIPITRDILIEAATLRAESGVSGPIRLPDAIHIATARANHCQTFLTNDKQLKKIPNVDVILMSEIKDSTLNVK